MRYTLIVLLLASALAQNAWADACSKSLTGTFPAEQARRLCATTLGTPNNPTIAGDLTFSKTSAEIVPGATSLLFRNNADDATNVSIADAGAVSTRAGVTAVTGNFTATAGSFVASASGQTLHLQEATSAAACMGTANANGTTAVTVATTCAATGARIFISATSDGTGATGNDQGDCWTTNIVNNTSFDLDCPDANNNAAYNWIIFKEAP